MMIDGWGQEKAGGLRDAFNNLLTRKIIKKICSICSTFFYWQIRIFNNVSTGTYCI